MNSTHLAYLASPGWADRLRADLLPWIERVAVLGDDVLEVGPGPGLTTDIIRERAAQVTAVELDGALAAALQDRMADTNVRVVQGDAGDLVALDLPDGRFTATTCFSVLHHVPTPEAQDRMPARLERIGFTDVDLEVGDYEIRFAARRPGS